MDERRPNKEHMEKGDTNLFPESITFQTLSIKTNSLLFTCRIIVLQNPKTDKETLIELVRTKENMLTVCTEDEKKTLTEWIKDNKQKITKFAIESLVRSRENVKTRTDVTTSNDGSNTALSLVTLNTRSVKNKTTSVCDFLTSNNVDIFALTETWLGSSVDKHIISEITPDGYDLHHVARTSRKGGGVAVIFNKSLEVKLVSSKHSFSHFELLECNVSSKHHRFRLCVIYRPPPSRINKLKTSTFFEEWSTFLDQLVIIPEEIVITGDLNFHLDDKNNSDACKFIETLEDHGLQQHINSPTHIHGHTLDVIITREISSILKNAPVVHHPYLCDKKGNPAGDHMALFAQLRISRPSKYRQTVTYRKYRDINLDDIKNDFVESIPPIVNVTEPVGNLVSLYNTNMISIIDKHAPIVSKEITLRPNTEWHTEELRDAKRNCRKTERRMRKTNLTVHQQIHRDACVHANKLLIRCKKEHYSTKVEEAEHDQKQLFRLSKRIMGEKQETILPSHKDEKDLANKFCQFFMNKIETIRANLSASNKSSITMCDIMKSDEKFNGEHLSSFKPTTITDLTKIIQSAPSKHKDPIQVSARSFYQKKKPFSPSRRSQLSNNKHVVLRRKLCSPLNITAQPCLKIVQ
ncbi:unnamed protein product [Mytilus edulis]|uniref:Endonuclease/exonuclease/phosphatase domain-containing protein n=1 Tax=Mytilus edulis TaxID=6550 RepID=A0A8S3V3E0_MYTED|nr:unnamed protein product [Mytilus edulis]